MADEGRPDNERLRALPAVDKVLAALESASAPRMLVENVRTVLDRARRSVLDGGETPSLDRIVELVRAELAKGDLQRLRPVINATGVLIHTNLGRVPLNEDQLAAA